MGVSVDFCEGTYLVCRMWATLTKCSCYCSSLDSQGRIGPKDRMENICSASSNSQAKLDPLACFVWLCCIYKNEFTSNI